MTTLIVSGTTILEAVASLTTVPGGYKTANAIYPVSAVTIVNSVSLPSDYAPGKYDWSGSAFVALGPQTPSPSYTTFKLRASDFLLRFTADERAAMRAIAAVVDGFADYLMQLQTVQYVDVLDNIVGPAMDALVAAGVIIPSRKAEILSPVLSGTESLVDAI